MALAFSNLSPPTEYGILLLEYAIPVSYLQPADKGPFPRIRNPVSDSDWVVGDRVRATFTGEGDRALKDKLRAC